MTAAMSKGANRNYINAYMQAASNGTIDSGPPSWMPHEIVAASRNGGGIDEIDGTMMNTQINNGNEGEGNVRQRVQVKLLCGADLLESFATPGLWSDEDLETILGEHGLVVITRSGSNPEKFIYDSDVLTHYKRNITLVTNWVPNEVSSTMIRRLLRRGESVKYLIDDNVLSYIKSHHLFGSTERTPKYLTVFDPLQPCITTPSPNDIIMKSPSDFQMQKDHEFSLKTRSSLSSKIMNYLIGVDEIDKNDVYTSSSSSTSTNHQKRSRLTSKVSSLDSMMPKSFCGGDDDTSEVSLPRKSVKVITDVSGVHKIVTNKTKVRDGDDDVVVVLLEKKKSSIDESKTSDGPLGIDIEKLTIVSGGNDNDDPKSPVRSYDEIVKFIFSEHGIQVISDRETNV